MNTVIYICSAYRNQYVTTRIKKDTGQILDDLLPLHRTRVVGFFFSKAGLNCMHIFIRAISANFIAV